MASHVASSLWNRGLRYLLRNGLNSLYDLKGNHGNINSKIKLNKNVCVLDIRPGGGVGRGLKGTQLGHFPSYNPTDKVVIKI